MKRLGFLLLFISVVFASCLNRFDDYDIAQPQQQGILAYTGGIFTPLVKYDSVAYAFFIEKDSTFHIARLTASGSFTKISDNTDLFSQQWRLDSLLDLDLYKVGDYMALYQESRTLKPYYWAITIVDTTGRTIARVTDTLHYDLLQIDTTLRDYFFVYALATDVDIEAFYVAITATDSVFLVVQHYDFVTGQFEGLEAKYVPYDVNLAGVFRFNYDLVLLANARNADSTYFLFYNHYQGSFENFAIVGWWQNFWQVQVDNDKVLLLAFKDFSLPLHYVMVDFTNKQILWDYVYTKNELLVPIDVIPYANSYIFLGFTWRNPLWYFSYAQVPNIKPLFTIWQSDGQSQTWSKTFNYEKVLPLGYLKQNDTLITAFSFGYAFGYYQATYVFKFSTSGKIFVE